MNCVGPRTAKAARRCGRAKAFGPSSQTMPSALQNTPSERICTAQDWRITLIAVMKDVPLPVYRDARDTTTRRTALGNHRLFLAARSLGCSAVAYARIQPGDHLRAEALPVTLRVALPVDDLSMVLQGSQEPYAHPSV